MHNIYSNTFLQDGVANRRRVERKTADLGDSN